MRWQVVPLFLGGAAAWLPEVELRGLHSSTMAGLDPWARIAAELERSLVAYDRPSEADAVARARATVGATAEAVLVLGGGLYVFEDHASMHKHKPHYFLSTLLSVLERSPLPNFAAAWDVGARGARCGHPALAAIPCLAIAKQAGYAARGLLVPNPYFAHVEEWDERCAAWRNATPAWADRKQTVFWRGAVRSACGSGNVARLEALTLTLSRPDLFDARAPSPPDAPDRDCEKTFPYTPAMVALATDAATAARVAGEFVSVNKFSRWRSYLNLPGTMGGSYSRNLNFLWPMRGVVYLWDGPAVEWYYPGLETGTTHAAVDGGNAVAAVAAVTSNASATSRLRAGSASVADDLLSGTGLERYWRLLAAALVRYFRLDAATLDAALADVDCDALRRVAWKRPEGPFYDETPGEGHPVLYLPLARNDPLRKRVRCRKSKS